MNELAQMHCSPVTANTPRLNEHEIGMIKDQLPQWQLYEKNGEPYLERSFKFADFNQALAFTDKVGKAASQEDHHPALLTEWGKVTVTWWTHKIKGLSQNDLVMAARTDQLYGDQHAGRS